MVHARIENTDHLCGEKLLENYSFEVKIFNLHT